MWDARRRARPAPPLRPRAAKAGETAGSRGGSAVDSAETAGQPGQPRGGPDRLGRADRTTWSRAAARRARSAACSAATISSSGCTSRNWPTALIDLGSLTRTRPAPAGGFEQAKFKFDYSLRALKLLNYNAMALSAEDLKVGVGEALSLFLNGLGETTKIVVANVQPAAGLRDDLPAQPDRRGRPGEGGRHRRDRPRGASRS